MERFVSALVALTLVAVPSGIAAQDTEWNRYTLEGLGGVFIRAEADPACESAGVAASKAQADAAMLLIDADVPVLTREQMLALPGLPELRISIACTEGGNGTSGALGYSVSVRVQQAAKMIRDEQVTLAEAVTWYSTTLGVAERADAQPAVLETLTGELEAFAAAYTEANAEKEGTP